MDTREILELFRRGDLSIGEAEQRLEAAAGRACPSAFLDPGRRERTGVPEVVFGEGKDAGQIIDIVRRMLTMPHVVIVTRVSASKAALVRAELPELRYHRRARMLTGNSGRAPGAAGRGSVAVLAAGTSDVPVAEEAALTLECLGHGVARAYDVGVAGIHRLFVHRKLLETAAVVIAVAGMEGALPSVVAGMVKAPVIAVPTSVGYGTGQGGLAALLAMLNSCAPGVAVVNIDNGFGAACVAAAINATGGEKPGREND